MSVEYLVGPAASGKTQTCIERVRSVLAERPLPSVWVTVPTQAKDISFRRRLALVGGALGANIGTFPDFYSEILARAGDFIPIAPEPVVHRMVRAAIDGLHAAGELPYYAPIRRTPGFIRAMAEHIAELKRAQITSEAFQTALQAREPRLREMAAIYRAYQRGMRTLGWADREGAGWLAARALRDHPHLLKSIELLVVDGFDSFSPLQLDVLSAVARQVAGLVITLSGEPEMARPAYRRFERTHRALTQRLSLQPTPLLPNRTRPEALRHLERTLFEVGAEQVQGGGSVTLIEAQTQALEVREALRWIKARIQRDDLRPSECALIAIDLRPYQAHLREVAREFQLPVRFVGGEALLSNPAVAAVMNVLQLPLLDWPRRLLLNVISSPYFDLSECGFLPDDAWRLEEVAQASQVIRGLDQWRQGLRVLAGVKPPPADDDGFAPLHAPHGEEALRLARALEQLVRRLSPRAVGSLADHAAWTLTLLEDGHGFGLENQVRAVAANSERDLAALAALRQQIDALVLSERVTAERPPLDYREFFAELRGAVEATSYQPESEQAWRGSRIYVADLSQARGVPFRAVALVGLAEGLFPAPLGEDPFLTDSDREALGRSGIALEPRLRSDQQTLFYEAATRAADFLLVTRPYLAPEGEAWEPSPYWQALRAVIASGVQRVRSEDSLPLHEAASKPELLGHALSRGQLPEDYAELGREWHDLQLMRQVLLARLTREPRGEFEGQAVSLAPRLTEVYGPSHVFSPGRLELYAGCKYHFFIQSALGLEERPVPQAGFDPAQLGTMLHEILERVYQQAGESTDLPALLSALEPMAAQVFADAPRVLGFRPSPLWEAERIGLLDDLRQTLHALSEFARGYRPLRLEARFGLEGDEPLRLETDAGEVLLHGVIDRVDVDEAGRLRVIDYKTGASHLEMRHLEQGRRLQIVVYGMAAEHRLRLGRLEEGVYWKIRQAEASSLKLSGLDYRSEDGRSYQGVHGATELVRGYIGAFVAGIRAGDFRPAPPEDGCPAYCPARLFCWRYTPA